MTMQLIQDMYDLLEQKLPQEAGIQLTADPNDTELQDIANRLQSVEIAQHERLALLGCYALVLHSLRIHDQLPADPTVAGRMVLDGDFLMSFYLQFALSNGFIQLITLLAPIIKQLQIRRAEKKHADGSDLHKHMIKYVAKHYPKQRYPLTQTYKQVTYDVI